MEKKLLAILGSPHKRGATGTMLEYVMNIAKQKGWHVDYIHLYEKNIAYCSGCCACTKTKNCVKQDDMQEITKLLRECDMVVLAAPVYWGNVPAVVKNMFDRLFGVAMEETKTFPKPLFSKKQKYFILTACHTQAPFDSIFGQSSGAVRNIKEFFRTGGMTYAGKCVWTGKSKTSMPQHIERKIKSIFK